MTTRNPTSITITVDGIAVEVIRKRVKHMRMSVHPPEGRVRVSAPHRIDDEAIRLAVVQRLPWIRKHQERIRVRPRQSVPHLGPGDVLFLWGDPYRLDVACGNRAGIELNGDTLVLVTPDDADTAMKRRMLDRWYQAQMDAVLPSLLGKWQPVIGEDVARITIRRMKSRWGSCTPSRRTIRLNLELATRNPRCLEYVLVHELVHLLERSHNARFYALMDRFLPTWRATRDELNQAPLSHAVWGPSPPADID